MAEEMKQTRRQKAARQPKAEPVAKPEVLSEECMKPTSFDETGNDKYKKKRRIGDRESKTVGKPSKLVTTVGLGKLKVQTWN